MLGKRYSGLRSRVINSCLGLDTQHINSFLHCIHYGMITIITSILQTVFVMSSLHSLCNPPTLSPPTPPARPPPTLLTTRLLSYRTPLSPTLLPNHPLPCVLCVDYVACTCQPSITPLLPEALVQPHEVPRTKYSHCSDPNLFHRHHRHDCHACQQ